MARSLTVQHEERATTSPLLTGFLLLAAAWLMLAAMFGADAYSSDAPVAPGAAVTDG